MATTNTDAFPVNDTEYTIVDPELYDVVEEGMCTVSVVVLIKTLPLHS